MLPVSDGEALAIEVATLLVDRLDFIQRTVRMPFSRASTSLTPVRSMPVSAKAPFTSSSSSLITSRAMSRSRRREASRNMHEAEYPGRRVVEPIKLCLPSLSSTSAAVCMTPEIGGAQGQRRRSELEGQAKRGAVPERQEIDEAGGDGAGELADGEGGGH